MFRNSTSKKTSFQGTSGALTLEMPKPDKLLDVHLIRLQFLFFKVQGHRHRQAFPTVVEKHDPTPF